MQHVIIGNSAAGIFAAEAIRRSNPQDKIVIVSDEQEYAYSRCLTSYYIAGKVDEQNMLIRSKDFYHEWEIEFCPGEKVCEVNTEQRFVLTNTSQKISFDCLLIASGARAVRPDISGNNSVGVYTLRTLADARQITSRCRRTSEAVVIGGGLVSLKAAYGLYSRGLKVTVIIASQQILSQVLDKEAADIIQKHLEEKGIRFIFGQDVTEICTDPFNECRGVLLKDGFEIPCGLVVIGKGVVPNTDFIDRAVIKVNQGIVVDRNMLTSLEGIYAAGDVAESLDYLNSKPVSYAIWPNAAAQGEIAGMNMAGKKTYYPGAISMNSLDFFGLNTISAGWSRASGTEFQISKECCPEHKTYKRFVFKDGTLIGYTLVGNIARAGILTGMIGQRVSEQDCRQLLKNGIAGIYPF